MKFLFKIIVFFILSSNVFAKSPCDNYFDALRNSENKSDVFWGIEYVYETTGINFDEILNSETNQYEYPTDDQGYYLVGSVNTSFLYDKISVGDSIISIDGYDIRNKINNNEMIDDLVEMDKDVEFVFKSKETNEKYSIKLKKQETIRFAPPYISSKINYIKVNEIDKTFDLSISSIHSLEVYKEDSEDFYNISRDNLFFAKGEVGTSEEYQICNFDEKKWRSLDTIDPSFGLKFINIVKYDKSLQKGEYFIWPQFEEFTGEKSYIKVDHTANELITFGTEFDLQSFPFDKQKLKIQKIQSRYYLDEFFSIHEVATENYLDQFVKKNPIEGWNIVDHKLSYSAVYDEDAGGYRDNALIELTIERKSSYYFFKIILPIALILLVCWSSLWITPREIESRLTITIVCLLSLIAYNFVIDSDLPKLEYLTTMDYIILISYFYAAMPNIFAIYSHNRLIQPGKKSKDFEDFGKKYGFLSYLGIVVFIVVLNSNISPDNTSTFLNFLKF